MCPCSIVPHPGLRMALAYDAGAVKPFETRFPRHFFHKFR